MMVTQSAHSNSRAAYARAGNPDIVRIQRKERSPLRERIAAPTAARRDLRRLRAGLFASQRIDRAEICGTPRRKEAEKYACCAGGGHGE